jgi:hypothetical protein
MSALALRGIPQHSPFVEALAIVNLEGLRGSPTSDPDCVGNCCP